MHHVYRHRQRGRFVTGVGLLLAAGYGVAAAGAGRPSLLIPAGIGLLVAAGFGTLTTEVRDGVLRFHFGPGVWRVRVPLADVAEAATTQSRWWEGIGIRITAGGMLYNVATGPAVEIRRRSGRRFRLGTDQPEALLRALRAPAAHG